MSFFKEKTMKNLLIMTTALVAMSTMAYAEQTTASSVKLTGSVGMEVTQKADNDFGAKTTLELGIATDGPAFGSIALKSVDEGTLTIDGWSLGMVTDMATFSIGDQGDIFPGAGLEVVGDNTLADPADNDSIKVIAGEVAMSFGFTDIKDDVTDLSNVQLGYTMSQAGININPVVDFNTSTNDVTYGLDTDYTMGHAALGGVFTFKDDVAYEVSAGMNDVTGFMNGDENNLIQNIGLGWKKTDENGMTMFAEAGYNVDTKATTPALGLSFNF